MTLELRPPLRRRRQPNEEVRQERTRPRRQTVQRWNKADLFRHIQEVSAAKVSRGSEGGDEEDPAVGGSQTMRGPKTVVKSVNCILSVMESLWKLSRGATQSDLCSKKQPWGEWIASSWLGSKQVKLRAWMGKVVVQIQK